MPRRSKPKILFSIIIILCGLWRPVFGQVRGDVVVNHEPTKDGEYVFYAFNSIAKDTHIVVVFNTGLNQWRPDAPLPFQKTISTGKIRLFKVTPVGTSQPRFDYRYYFYNGVGNPEISDVEYAIPGAEDETVLVRGITEPTSKPDEEGGYRDYYGVGFYTNDIRSTRDGQVRTIRVVQGDPQKSFIQVRHRDGTVGNYYGAVNGTLTVNEDQVVKAGDIMAKAGIKSRDGTLYFNFSVSYMKVVVDKDIDSREWSSTRYLIPLFRTVNKERVRLKRNVGYTASYPDELITQEMSKREKKRYLKSKKN
ncbi:hypothetical protein BFP97_18225 [Roseivirga sp. 4D4]|uniref:hypothetical protein n=1 Tax=Roseivirga sp. 4D4 TaxID=1889784 RepID=UPI000853839A|nr:hypothetical protein [Roseivirga sp. 4D4]OEK03340.1 hypothetical protein BFP97_18225 [Roseivirga sp. 4D4]